MSNVIQVPELTADEKARDRATEIKGDLPEPNKYVAEKNKFDKRGNLIDEETILKEQRKRDIALGKIKKEDLTEDDYEDPNFFKAQQKDSDSISSSGQIPSTTNAEMANIPLTVSGDSSEVRNPSEPHPLVAEVKLLKEQAKEAQGKTESEINPPKEETENEINPPKEDEKSDDSSEKSETLIQGESIIPAEGKSIEPSVEERSDDSEKGEKIDSVESIPTEPAQEVSESPEVNQAEKTEEVPQVSKKNKR